MAGRWIEASVAAPSAWLELVADALRADPTASVAFATDERLPAGWERATTHWAASDDSPALRSGIERRLSAITAAAGDTELARARVEFRDVPDADFASAWRSGWRPLRIGKLRVVTPDWRGSAKPGELVLRLEPGGAFGTGRHATTRECLRALQELLRPGERVLDVGSGTAILAAASVLLGAEHAFAFDNDATAAPYARELCELNGVADRVELATGGFELLARRERKFDGVLANIYADLIQRHATDLARALAPGGWFVVSGCASVHRAAVAAALASAGLSIERRVTRSGWDTFRGRLHK